jgi:DNA-binding response OmpR family regulator
VSDDALQVLLVDDEPALREVLIDAFTEDGRAVTAVASGDAALATAAERDFDMVILDVALGEAPDGVEVCRRLRAMDEALPIIMLTARSGEADAVRGLEAGADDYVAKPFGLAELRSRISAVLRRSRPRESGAPRITLGDLRIDPGCRQARVGDVPLELTFSEFEILHALAEDPRLHTRQELLRRLWGDERYRDPRAVDVHVHRLRSKLRRAGADLQIVTVRGAGYRLAT